MSEEVAKVLEDAADLLERDGRCKKGGIGPNGERCASVAIFASGPRPCWAAYEAVRDHLGESVPRWNDRTEDDQVVLDTLRSVAADLRGSA